MFLTGTIEQRAENTLKILQLELPLCFKEQEKKPLKINITNDVLDYFNAETRFSVEDIDLAIKRYMQDPLYLQTLLPGAIRIDIYGNAAGYVTLQEAEKAIKQLTLKKTLLENKQIA